MFSVIIPAYNAALYIHNTINSVLHQSIEDFEILVVDDGSTDETRAIVESMEDKRIHYIYQVNSGVSSARNTGIRNSRGAYTCFLDADDFWHPNHLEVVNRLINKFPFCSVYLTGYEILLHDGTIMKKFCPSANEDMQSDNVFKEIWNHGYFFNTNSVVCKKSAFDEVGLFEDGIKNGEDDDLWYRLFTYFSVAITKEITTTYIRENSKATEMKVFVEDWIFLNRIKNIMSNSAVSLEKKNYLCRLIEQRKLSLVRHYILSGDKKKAWAYLRQVNVCMLKKKKYITTVVACLIPYKISSYVVKIRDRKYFRK